MLRVLLWVLEIVAILWLLRFLWRMAANWLGFPEGSPQFESGRPPQRGDPVSTGPRLSPRELKKDPQCGTYVSPELSIRARFRGEELHFCSRECEQKFFQVQSGKSA